MDFVHLVDYGVSLSLILFGAWGMFLKMKGDGNMSEKWFEYVSVEDAAMALVRCAGFDQDRYVIGKDNLEEFSEEDLLEMIEDNGEFILPVNSNSIVVKWNSDLDMKG